MLDVGFEEDVRVILGKTCSVHRLAEEYMDPNPIKVVIGSEDLAANHDVMQIVERFAFQSGLEYWYLSYTRQKLIVLKICFREGSHRCCCSRIGYSRC
ncbi:DEAD-box ATP-dependent RNA helicase 5-like isoform X2 [Durio zibethinus]|uniref:DEAD-box ATP-dependent RNA helicase 5-like isoform X2 n=1 Tax=Durio zibethinus TaxID=66656 RepID=A0A6P5Y6X5_DURZI|nr:DEAD-box ATP-dependent RNA helicase 5-like isoform X2 [Durio zibethinus]